MAKYTITRRCGHKETVSIFGRAAEREWRQKKEEEKLCSDCYRAELDAKRAAESAAAAEAAKEAGLPTLVGSEKQVAWAETIRQKAMTHIQAMRLEADATEVPADVREAAIAFLDEIASTQDAKYWIDQREWLAGSQSYFEYVFMDRLQKRMKP